MKKLIIGAILTYNLDYIDASPDDYSVDEIVEMLRVELQDRYEELNLDYFSLMPTNLYGPNDNYDITSSHVPAALIRKFHEAKISNLSEVEVWGSGLPRREFMHVNDMADACIHIMKTVDFNELAKDMEEIKNTHINIGTGKDVTIKELAEMVKDSVGFKGEASPI